MYMLPSILKPGDTLGVVAPASPFDPALFEMGVRAIEDMGFNLSVDKVVNERLGYLAGSDHQRADHLMRMFDDPEIDGIICARGGYGAMRTLQFLDEDRIAANPKAFVGFSDITALLSFLFSRCRMVCFHGPTLTTLGKGAPSTREHFYSTMTRPLPMSIKASKARVIRQGNAKGPFLCGNLTLFCHLTGTLFQPNFSGSIVLFEDQGEAPYRIDRMLTQMRLAGCFDGVAGVALGSFKNCGTEKEIHTIFADVLSGLGVPLVAGFDVGHTDVNLTVPVGAPVELESDTCTLRFNAPERSSEENVMGLNPWA
jgi:muramoyltetrapeptide carboxypeptidase